MLDSFRSLVSPLGPFVCLAAALAAAGGCGDDATANDDGSGGAGGVDDGKYYPPTNGVVIDEDAACQQLLAARKSVQAELTDCPLTSPLCPALLRAQFSVACMNYDEGSVQGCVDHYGTATDCASLHAAIDECVVTPIEGSEPAGCPE